MVKLATPTLTPAPAVKSTQTPSVTEPSRAIKRPTSTRAVASSAVYTTTITLPTYPFRRYLVEQVDPLYNIPVLYLNRPEYEAAAQTPVPTEYEGVVLENPYLRLTFLPELGGRLYSAIVKATNQEVFYHNPVVKPSRYGGLEPVEANWWLASGGMEWAYPVQEHGFRFGVPWQYRVDETTADISIILTDTAPERTGLQVTVTLPKNSSTFLVEPELINDTGTTVPVQVWTNAALALNAGGMSPDTQFIIPSEVITVHSRGEADWAVPEAQTQAPWPRISSNDLSDYRQWANYLGFFVSNTDASFIAAYNPTGRLGMARLLESDPELGAGKVFAFGPAFPDRSYTDDESQYFEIWGGANAAFWPEYDIEVSPGQKLTWTERWWPLAGLPHLTWATSRVAISVSEADPNNLLSILVAEPLTGTVDIFDSEGKLLETSLEASPAVPEQLQFPEATGPITIEIRDEAGKLLLNYTSQT
jgi:hypothetical protein